MNIFNKLKTLLVDDDEFIRDDQIQFEAVRIGNNEFIEKPFRVEVLFNLLTQISGRRPQKPITTSRN